MKILLIPFFLTWLLNFQVLANDGLFKKILLINEQGKITVVNPEAVIGFKRVGVNSGKNFLTSVLELDNEGKIRECRYKCSASQIVEKAEAVGVKFDPLKGSNGGEFINPAHYDKTDGFVTKSSFHIKNELHGKVANRLKNPYPIKGRTGTIYIKGEPYFNVSKRMVPKVKSGFSVRGFSRGWARFVGVVSGVLSLSHIIYATNQEINARHYYSHFKATKNILINEYNQILYLEDELPVSELDFLHLIYELESGPCELRRYTTLTDRLIGQDSSNHNDFKTSYYNDEGFLFYHPKIEDLSPFKLSILGLIADEEESFYEELYSQSANEVNESMDFSTISLLVVFGLLSIYGIILEIIDPTIFRKR